MRRITLYNTSTLTAQAQASNKNAAVYQLKTMNTVYSYMQNVLNRDPRDFRWLGVMLTKCIPTLNGFRLNQLEVVVNACLVLNIECA